MRSGRPRAADRHFAPSSAHGIAHGGASVWGQRGMVYPIGTLSGMRAVSAFGTPGKPARAPEAVGVGAS